MEEIGFGLIGLGLMGREFASAAARWRHLPEMSIRPRVVAVCDLNLTEEMENWYRGMLPDVSLATRDYRDLLDDPRVEAVYCAVPHHLHAEIFVSAIEAGKHLLGEKPFGIDLEANRRILEALEKRPRVFARCSGEFPFFPAAQALCSMIERGVFGRLIGVEAGLLHSSDLDTAKPINWKRMLAYNGAYGCLGDLGMHVCQIPFRAGWFPGNVRAVLNNLVENRPDNRGGYAPCETWDNADLFCEAPDHGESRTFPLHLKTYRISPGDRNTWYLKVFGMQASACFSTRNPNSLRVLESTSGNGSWREIEIGHTPAFRSITGGIFEFGFSDAVLQMCAAYLYELKTGKPLRRFAGCITPEETAASHRLFTAALESFGEGSVVRL